MKKITLVPAIAALLSIIACEENNGYTSSYKNDIHPSELVGQWFYESGENYVMPEYMELFKDGTGIWDNETISWEIEREGDIKYLNGEFLHRIYEVHDSRLIIYHSIFAFYKYNKSDITIYVKKDEYEKAIKKAMANIKKGSFTDTRDGKIYKTVKIGEQIWMAENLNYDAEDSKCYENDPANCQKYGRLYNWNTAMKVCPEGWKLPKSEEWDILTVTVGSSITQGKYLKATSGWNSNGNGTDAFGFSALPGGYGSPGGNFYYVGDYGYWWIGKEYRSYKGHGKGWEFNAASQYMYYYYDNVKFYLYPQNYLFSVRCLKD